MAYLWECVFDDVKGGCMMDAEDKERIKEEYEKILNVIADCTDDYIYLFDLSNDYFRVS